MDKQDWLAQRFEEHRTHLRAVAYRMLGSLAEADEAVQDAWLRLSRAGAEGVENLGGWLTTIVARVCLNVLQARKARPEQPADFDALIRVLHPDVVLRSDVPIVGEQRGAKTVARMALAGTRRSATVLHVLVNGTAGCVIVEDGRAALVMAFAVSSGKIVEIDVITDSERLHQLDLGSLGSQVPF